MYRAFVDDMKKHIFLGVNHTKVLLPTHKYLVIVHDKPIAGKLPDFPEGHGMAFNFLVCHTLTFFCIFLETECFKLKKNKYAIYAYTHGPVTRSGPSVKPLKYDVAPY